MSVVVLAGGSGGAKLARGMLDVVGDELVVVANTGDDLEIYGSYVSPDPDLVTFGLLDRIDPRGWGLLDDTFETMAGLEEIGAEAWFSLGDRDLAYSIERKRRLDAGERLTQAQAAIGVGLGLNVAVLPMCDEPVRTRVRSGGAWHDFQAFMIQLGGGAQDFDAVDGVELVGIEATRITPEVEAAIAAAEAIVIGPSNPIISIGPILRVGGMRAALQASAAPVVAVSPIVAGASVKGPTMGFMRWAGVEPTSAGIARLYAGLIDGLVADERVDAVATLETDTLMSDPEARRRVAAETLEFARALRP
ncbi:MAG: 2-phospho-L-lactate transferase [Solirubrobacterales bacterium]|nr:2-phospho-L-lactate transferase [Solirubrobacterales bacterium]